MINLGENYFPTVQFYNSVKVEKGVKGYPLSSFDEFEKIRDFAVGKVKENLPAIQAKHSEQRGKGSFTHSNVCIIDIDKKTDEIPWNVLYDLTEFKALPNVYCYQESFSGKIHLLMRIPDVYSEKDFLKCSCVCYNLVDEFFKGYGIELSKKELDTHSISPAQMLFISSKPFLVNNYCYITDEVKSLFDEVLNNDENEVEEKSVKKCELYYIPKLFNTYIENALFYTFLHSTFKTTPKVDKYINDIIQLDFTHTSDLIKNIIDEVIYYFPSIDTGRLSLRPNIKIKGSNVISFSHKLITVIKRDEEGNIIKVEQGHHRRLKLITFIKIAILNEIATSNYYHSRIRTENIIFTIKWLLLNVIETKGTSRDITFDILKKEVLEVLRDKFDEIEILYKENSFYDSDEIKNIKCQKDVRKYGQHICKVKYSAIEKTALSFINDNELTGYTYKEIADALNVAKISTKRKNSEWSEDMLKKLLNKAHISTESKWEDRCKELLTSGMKYAEIASKLKIEGYLTKQGKEIKEQNIKNFKRKLNK